LARQPIEVLLPEQSSDEENQEPTAVKSKCRNACRNAAKKVSPPSAFLPVVSCFSPAAGIGIQALGFSPVTLVTELSGIAQLWFSSQIWMVNRT